MHEDVVGRAAEHQWADQFDGVRQRQDIRDGAHGRGQLRERKEHARKQHHRRDHKRLVEHEEVVVGRQRRHVHRQAGEGEPREDDNRKREQRRRHRCITECARHQHDRQAREDRLARRPDQLAEHHIAEREGRVQDGLPRALDVHARERRIHRLEAGRHHRARGHRAGRQEGNVRDAVDMPDQQSEPQAQAEQIDHRIGKVARHRRDGQLAPDHEVAQPDGLPVAEVQRQQRLRVCALLCDAGSGFGRHGEVRSVRRQSRISRPVRRRKTSSRLAGRCR